MLNSSRCTCRHLGSDLGSGGQGSAAEQRPTGEVRPWRRRSGETKEGWSGLRASVEQGQAHGVLYLGRDRVEGVFRVWPASGGADGGRGGG